MDLIVGELSTWSMRAWLCLRMANISFNEVIIPLGSPGYRELLAEHSDSLLVPVLNTGEFKIHDSLAIAEYCNELSGGLLLPPDQKQRAQCRSLVSELHSGFQCIRSTLPFSWTAAPVYAVAEELRRDLQRLESIWGRANGAFYYRRPSLADAFYAVMACRLDSYGIRFDAAAGDYQQSLQEWPLFDEAIQRARQWAAPSATR